MTAETPNAVVARDIVFDADYQGCGSCGGSQDLHDIVRRVEAALSAKDKELEDRVPTEEEIDAARILWAEGVGRLSGIPETQIESQKHLIGKQCWNDAVRWAISYYRNSLGGK